MSSQLQPLPIAVVRAHAQGVSTVHAIHEVLAARCGVSRPKLTTEFKHLEAQGLIRRGGGVLDILSLDTDPQS